MEKFILMPDSFKGTLTSLDACEIMSCVIRRFIPEAEILSIPIADGGEGTVDCFVAAAGAKKIRCPSVDPLGRTIDSFYGILPDGTAVIEMAAAAGLPLLEGELAPMDATTYGVGLLIKDAVQKGAVRIVLGLGGSATTDGGTGAAAALGAVFRNRTGDIFLPTGGTLEEIASVDLTAVKEVLAKVEVVAMCDIDNPLYGDKGAAYQFAPQKGAQAEQVEQLERGLRHFAEIALDATGIDAAAMPGAGAAGGMGAGAVLFFGAKLKRGIDAILDTVAFESCVKDASLIFTGEGRLDGQSIGGKVISGIARRAKKCDVPVIAVVGGAEPGLEAVYDVGVTAVFPINRLPMAFEQAKMRAQENLRDTMEDIVRLYLACKD